MHKTRIETVEHSAGEGKPDKPGESQTFHGVINGRNRTFTVFRDRTSPSLGRLRPGRFRVTKFVDGEFRGVREGLVAVSHTHAVKRVQRSDRKSEIDREGVKESGKQFVGATRHMNF